MRGTVIQLAAVAVVVLVNGFFGFWSGPPEAPAAVHNFLAVSGPVPAYALLIWAVVRTDGLVSRLLSTRVIVWLGTISYGIYLFHYTVMRWHVALLPSLDGVPVIVQYAAIWAVTIAMAGVTFYLIERPARHGIVAAWRRAMARSPDGTLGGSIIPVRRRISALLMTHRLIVTRAAVAAAVLLVVVGVSWTVLTVARPQPPLGPVPADMDAWRLKVLIAALVGGTLGGAVASLIRGPGQTSDTRSLVGSMPVAAIAGAALGLIAVDAVMLTVLRHFEDEIALKDMRAAGHALVAGGAFVAAFITVICGRMLLSGRTRAERTGHTDQTEARPEAASQPVLLADATVEGVTPDPAIQAR